jgi:hypothetical protein
VKVREHTFDEWLSNFVKMGIKIGEFHKSTYVDEDFFINRDGNKEEKHLNELISAFKYYPYFLNKCSISDAWKIIINKEKTNDKDLARSN